MRRMKMKRRVSWDSSVRSTRVSTYRVASVLCKCIMKSIRRDNCENEFFYELNCVENGEWIPEKITLEDTLVRELRFIWNHRYNLERRYIQQFLRSSAARWRFKRQQKEVRRRLIRELRVYRGNREFAADTHQSLENWYLQNRKNAWISLLLLIGLTQSRLLE